MQQNRDTISTLGDGDGDGRPDNLSIMFAVLAKTYMNGDAARSTCRRLLQIKQRPEEAIETYLNRFMKDYKNATTASIVSNLDHLLLDKVDMPTFVALQRAITGGLRSATLRDSITKFRPDILLPHHNPERSFTRFFKQLQEMSHTARYTEQFVAGNFGKVQADRDYGPLRNSRPRKSTSRGRGRGGRGGDGRRQEHGAGAGAERRSAGQREERKPRHQERKSKAKE